jgi:quercetin dioxygenase-like cupin family protein
MMRRWLFRAVLGCLSLALAGLAIGQVVAKSSALSRVPVQTLATGPVKSLPAGKVYLSILEFRQQPGAEFGPHAHQASIAYTLHGTDTIAFRSAAAQSVGPGKAAFIPTLAAHTHQNLDGRIGAGAMAVGLIVLVILLCAATWMRGGPRRATIAALSVLLIAGGTLPLIGATANDYYLIAVRPSSQRSQPMPRPDGRVLYESPDVNPVPPGPYVEALSAITVPAGATYDSPVIQGPQLIIVLEGNPKVNVGDETTQLTVQGATMAQAGQTLTIVNSGADPLQVLDFGVTSVAVSPAGT